MAKYAIWNKKDTIYTPVGEAVAPEEWVKRFGWINNPNAVPVIGGGIVNGSFSGELHDMKERCENSGAVFGSDLTNEELLKEIENFENSMNTKTDSSPSANERIAAALEAQVLMAMPDEETEE